MSTTDERDDGSLETARVPTVEPAEGDDIVVVPAGPEDPERQRRRRAIYALAGVAVAVLIVGGIALVARDHGTSASSVQLSPATTVQPKPISETHPTTVPKTTAPAVVVTTAPPQTAPPQTSPPATAVTQQTSPPATTPVVAPTIATPKQYGVTRLTWTAPSTLRIVSGGTAGLAVVAHNPTDGTITLPHPLACTPRLDQGEICTEMAQLIGAGQSASAQYTVDAHGIAPGNYTLRIEGVLTIPVIVS